MRSIEAVAAELISELPARDQLLVRGWQQLGYCPSDALLASGTLGRGQQVDPTQAAARAAADRVDELLLWRRRQYELPDAATTRRMVCEHESAHALVAVRLGVRVRSLKIDEDGLAGETWHERTGDQIANAAIAMAGEQ